MPDVWSQWWDTQCYICINIDGYLPSIWHFHIEECVLPYMAVCAKRCFILLGKTTSWRVTVIAARSPMVFFIYQPWGFPARHGGTPKTLDGLFHGSSHRNKDDLGVPLWLRKPPNCSCIECTKNCWTIEKMTSICTRCSLGGT